jgi:hypothetical protein
VMAAPYQTPKHFNFTQGHTESTALRGDTDGGVVTLHAPDAELSRLSPSIDELVRQLVVGGGGGGGSPRFAGTQGGSFLPSYDTGGGGNTGGGGKKPVHQAGVKIEI